MVLSKVPPTEDMESLDINCFDIYKIVDKIYIFLRFDNIYVRWLFKLFWNIIILFFFFFYIFDINEGLIIYDIFYCLTNKTIKLLNFVDRLNFFDIFYSLTIFKFFHSCIFYCFDIIYFFLWFSAQLGLLESWKVCESCPTPG